MQKKHKKKNQNNKGSREKKNQMKRKRLIPKKFLIYSRLFNFDSQLARGKGGG
jgi:hypothetical protein